MVMCGQGETAWGQWKKLKALYAALGMQQVNTKAQVS